MSSGPTGGEALADRVIQVRHDLRNPLGHIMGFSELLLEAAGRRGYEESLADLRLMEKECEKMIVVINSTLDVARMESGGGDVGGLVRTLGRFATGVRSRCAALKGHAEERRDEHFITDLGRIEGSAIRMAELVEGPLTGLGDWVKGELGGESARVIRRWESALVLAVDCGPLVGAGRAMDPGLVVDGIAGVHEWARELAKEGKLHSSQWTGGYGLLWSGNAGGAETIVGIALRLLERARHWRMGEVEVSAVRLGLATGEVIEGGDVIDLCGDAVARALVLAGRAMDGELAVESELTDSLVERFRIEDVAGLSVIRGRRV